MQHPTITTKRAYDPPDPSDGCRALVDRLWPRGLNKERAGIEVWTKEVAPSNELRTWFGHDPAKWAEFQERYKAELDANPEAWEPLLQRAQQGPLTLVYSARDSAHNNAVVLRGYLVGKQPPKEAKGRRGRRGHGGEAAAAAAER